MLMFRLSGLVWLFVVMMLTASFTIHAETVGEIAKSEVFKASSIGFSEPFLASKNTSSDEDDAILAAIKGHQARKSVDDYQALTGFLEKYPDSGWSLAVSTNLGWIYYQSGRFSKAIETWERAWLLGKAVKEDNPKAKALADRALGELLRMHARIGHKERLAELLTDMGKRSVSGSATEYVTGAKEGLWVMKNKPGIAYLCGPMALKNVLLSQGKDLNTMKFLTDYQSGEHGVSLKEVAELAKKANVPYQLIKRSPSQKVPLPSVVHWRANHYAAIIEERNGFYHVRDPIFGDDLWITQDAIDDEASGHFLVLTDQLEAGWQALDTDDAAKVYGMGYVIQVKLGSTLCGNHTAQDKSCSCSGNTGMCGYSFAELPVSLRLSDSPVGYKPPIGQPVYTNLVYNQREDSQPANFSFFNISPKWSLNWLSYIQDDPAIPGASVVLIAAGGGSISYGNYDANTGQFKPDAYDGATLKLVSSNPIVYQKQFADGSIDEYRQSNGATTAPRLIFLSKRMDAQGNTLTFNYDTQQRLTSITDATGRNTTFSYGNANPLLITAITDPFGRSAQLIYDANGRLLTITDVIGMQSSFHYDAQSLIDSMTTPYGTTTFSYGSIDTWRWLQATDPLGQTERLEFRQQAPNIPHFDPANTIPEKISNPFNNYLDGRNTFYWDKHAYPLALLPDGSLDYTKARNRHWVHVSASIIDVASEPIESIKYPNENRIWFNYPGQDSWLGTAAGGTLNKPSLIGRVLDDGTTQLYQYNYNSLGNITQAIDPLGRETQYTYDTNQIDVIKIEQKTSASGYSTIAQYTYNAQHLPLTYTDAAGQTTQYSYNAKGQLTQVTNPLNQVTKYNYDAQNNLTSITNANNKTELSLTYDTKNRVATRTDSEGYTLSYTYDDLDRVTKVTYPDGTNDTTTWDKLDIASETDRLGHTTQYQYDAVRHLTKVTPPLTTTATQYSYFPNGKLKTQTDANGNVTTWSRDIQSRVTAKTYADGKKDQFTYETTTSRLKSSLDAKNQTKQYSYFNDNQLKQVSYLNAVVPTATVSFTYDPYFPYRTSMVDGTGTTQYQYVPVGQLGALQLKQSDGAFNNDVVSYQYDALGRVSSRTIDTTTDSYTYDNLGRVTQHNTPIGNYLRTYLGETEQIIGEHKQVASGVGLGTDWQYDTNTNDRRLKSITHTKGKNFYYTRNAEDIITNIHETSNVANATTQDATYTYDNNDRLTKSVNNYINNPYYTHYTWTYTLDGVNNITDVLTTDGGSSDKHYTVNNLNQIDWSSYSYFTYDANGNTTADKQLRVYEWDAENRLTKISPKPGLSGNTTTLQYDGLGRFTKITTSQNGERRFLWCGDELCQSRNSSDTVQKHFYEEGFHNLIANRPSIYYIKDQLGSVHNGIDVGSQFVYSSFHYDPYGWFYRSSQSGTNIDEFRYAGMFYLEESELYFTRHRAYDPRTGRWLSRDPIEEAGGINLYGYVEGNPVNFRDPLGLFYIPSSVVNSIVNGIKNAIPSNGGMCQTNPSPQPCDPPEGTICYGSWHDDHAHKGKKPHRHLYQHQFNRTSGQCQWKKLKDTDKTVGMDDKNANIITPGMMPCQFYPNWTP